MDAIRPTCVSAVAVVLYVLSLILLVAGQTAGASLRGAGDGSLGGGDSRREGHAASYGGRGVAAADGCAGPLCVCRRAAGQVHAADHRAGPAGPNGRQIFIDGFAGGRLPPKSSIREIRVTANPFSAEYDRLGFGRIEIFTRPGTDRFRGQIMAMLSDNVLNARNPFVTERPSFRSGMFVGSAGGPLTRRSSFNLDVERRGMQESAVVNATVLDASLLPTRPTRSILTPQSRWNTELGAVRPVHAVGGRRADGGVRGVEPASGCAVAADVSGSQHGQPEGPPHSLPCGSADRAGCGEH